MSKPVVMPFPNVNVGEVLGLVEMIYSYGLKVKISYLADELGIEIDRLGDVINMAELLNLVKVENGYLELTIYGEVVSVGNIDDKKRVIRRMLSKIEPFKSAINYLKNKGLVKAKELLAYLYKKFPISNRKRFEKLFINWANYAEFIEYDGEDNVFHLPDDDY